MSDSPPPGGRGNPFEPGNSDGDQVPLPPMAPPVTPTEDASTSSPSAGATQEPSGPPKKKGSIGRAVLLTLLGMLVLFGVGFGLGQLFRGDKASTSASSPATAQASPAACATVEVTPSAVPPSEVSVEVLNSGAAAGSAAKTAASLTAAGFKVGTVGNDSSSSSGSGAVIRYGSSGEAAANTLKGWLTGDVTLEPSGNSDSQVVLLLHDGFGGVASESEAQANLAKPSPSLSGPDCPSPSASTSSSTEASASPSESASA